MISAIIALGYVTVFGVVGIISTFVRQLLLSREKNLNDLAQQRALQQEFDFLATVGQELSQYKRNTVDYYALGIHKEFIQNLNQQIDVLLKNQYALIAEYTVIVKNKSFSIIQAKGVKTEDKKRYDIQKQNLDEKLHFLQTEIETLQNQRAYLLDNHKDFLQYTIAQEKSHDKKLASYYKQQMEILEKFYLRHHQNALTAAEKKTDLNTTTFKTILLAPIYFLMSAFNISTEVNPDTMEAETKARNEVYKWQLSINRVKNHSETGDGSDSLLQNHNGLFRHKTKDSTNIDDTEYNLHLKSEFIF